MASLNAFDLLDGAENEDVQALAAAAKSAEKAAKSAEKPAEAAKPAPKGRCCSSAPPRPSLAWPAPHTPLF